MYKTLLWLALWVISLSPLAFASADSVNWFNSNSPIYSQSFNGDYLSLGDTAKFDYINDDWKYYICLSSSDYPYIATYNYDSSTYNINIANYCFSEIFNYSDESFSFSKEINWVFYQSATPITYSSSSDSWNSDSSLIPNIPSSFTSWLTSLVSNFGSIVVNWLPTIILLSLGIYAIFALFRVVRWYAKSTFNW